MALATSPERRFALEPKTVCAVVGVLTFDDLEGNRSTDIVVARLVDFAHSPLPRMPVIVYLPNVVPTRESTTGTVISSRLGIMRYQVDLCGVFASEDGPRRGPLACGLSWNSTEPNTLKASCAHDQCPHCPAGSAATWSINHFATSPRS